MFHVLTTVKLFSPTLYRIFSPLYIILYHIMSYHIIYHIILLYWNTLVVRCGVEAEEF